VANNFIICFLLEKLIVAQLVEHFPFFMETSVPLSCSQEPHLDPDESSPQLLRPILILS
jgi:hypothetical protein